MSFSAGVFFIVCVTTKDWPKLIRGGTLSYFVSTHPRSVLQRVA